MATTGWGAFGAGAWSQHAENNFNVETQQPLYSAPVPIPQSQPHPPVPIPVSSPAYNPSTPSVPYYSTQPPSSPTLSLPPHQESDTFSDSMKNADLAKREQALMRREADLAIREKQLADMQADLESKGLLPKKKNWPICFPILHHDIAGDISPAFRRPVREGYIAWMGLVWCLSWNFFCASVMLGQDANQKVPSWFLTVIYWVCGVPLSFYSWYRCLYNGAKSNSGFRFVTFLATFAVHTAFCIWATIAVPFSANQWSFCGFMTALKAVSHGTFPSVVYWIGSGFWCAEAVFSLWVIRDVWFFFRSRKDLENENAADADAAASAGPSWAANSTAMGGKSILTDQRSDQPEKTNRFSAMLPWNRNKGDRDAPAMATAAAPASAPAGVQLSHV